MEGEIAEQRKEIDSLRETLINFEIGNVAQLDRTINTYGGGGALGGNQSLLNATQNYYSQTRPLSAGGGGLFNNQNYYSAVKPHFNKHYKNA